MPFFPFTAGYSPLQRAEIMIKGGPFGERGGEGMQNVPSMTGDKNIGGRPGEGMSSHWRDWEWQLRNRVQSLERLASAMNLPGQFLAAWRSVVGVYPFAITPYYWSLLDASDPEDPLRLQCFPDPRELDSSGGGVDDPLGEEAAMPVPGLIHRYPDRCLAIVTGDCAVYCRHCNRKRRWRDGKTGSTRERLANDGGIRSPNHRRAGGDRLRRRSSPASRGSSGTGFWGRYGRFPTWRSSGSGAGCPSPCRCVSRRSSARC